MGISEREEKEASRGDAGQPQAHSSTGSTAPTAGGTQHSPLPWFSKRASIPVDGEYDYAIGSESHGVIAEVFGRSGVSVFPPAEANADYIVRACNAYPQIEAFLRRVAWEPIGPSDATADQILDSLTREAQALLEEVSSK